MASRTADSNCTSISPVPNKLGEIYRNIADTHFNRKQMSQKKIGDLYRNRHQIFATIMYILSGLRDYS